MVAEGNTRLPRLRLVRSCRRPAVGKQGSTGALQYIGSRPFSIPIKEGGHRPPSLLVRIVGLEPTRRGHRNLNPTRLPIPSYPQVGLFYHSLVALSIDSGEEGLLGQ